MSQRTAYLSLLLAILALLGISLVLGVLFFQSLPTPEEEEGQASSPAAAGGAGAAEAGAAAAAGPTGASRKFGLHRPGSTPVGPTGFLDLVKFRGAGRVADGAVAPAGPLVGPGVDCGDSGDRFDLTAPGAGFNLYPAPGEVVLCMQRPDMDPKLDEDVRRSRGFDCLRYGREVCITMRILGILPTAYSKGPSSGYGADNYLVGNNPQNWFSDLPPFPRVSYSGIYQGVDLMVYGDQTRFELLFHLEPGANMSDISLQYLGATALGTDAAGNLAIDFDGGRIRQGAPVVFDIIDGVPYPAAGRHVVENGRVSVRARDAARDSAGLPGAFDQLGYLGGSGREGAWAMATDNRGCGYVVGEASFPGTGQGIQGRAGSRVFVTRYRVADSEPLYNTFLNGSGNDRAYAVAADQFGNAYICGETTSADLPGSGANGTGGGLGGSWDAFVTKLDGSGKNVEYTYRIKGSADDRAYALAVDREGNVYLAGETQSPDFPFTSMLNTVRKPGGWDAFVLKLDASGSFIHYAACVGGSGDDVSFGLGLALDGTVTIAGGTSSTDFPMAGTAPRPFAGGWDAFVARLSADGKALLYSTCFGGSNDERALGVGIDLSGNAYIGGETASRNLPVTNALQALHGGGDWDAFAARFESGGEPVYATYFGGSGNDRCFAVSPSPSGAAALAGATSSTNFPACNAMQLRHGGGAWDAFVAMLSPTGRDLQFSSCLGGAANDFLYSVVQDARRGVHMAGTTSSSNLPAFNSMQTRFGGGFSDAMLAHIPASFRPDPELRLVKGGGQPGGPEYDFYMGKFEITNEEFVRFLNDAQANTNNIRGTNLWFDGAGNVWFNPAMQPERDEIFTVSDSRILYNPDFPVGARYHVSPDIPGSGGSYSDHPSAGMSWYGAVKYCNWLTIATGRGADQLCYREGTSRFEWAPVTCSPTNWAAGFFSMAEREHWLRFRGFRLPMDNCLGRSSVTNRFNEFLKAAAWSGSTNHLYGYGRSTVEPGDANYLNDEILLHNDTVPVGFFDGSDHGGRFRTRTNFNHYGIFDLSGSVLEWLTDAGTTNANDRASYGGCWMFNSTPVQDRYYVDPYFTDSFRGFRVVTTEPSLMQQVVRIPYDICLKGCGEGLKPGEKPPEEELVEPGEEPPAKEPNVLTPKPPPEMPPDAVYKKPPPVVPPPGPPPPPPPPGPPPPVSPGED